MSMIETSRVGQPPGTTRASEEPVTVRDTTQPTNPLRTEVHELAPTQPIDMRELLAALDGER